MTERNLTAAMKTAVRAPVVRPALLYEGEFANGQFVRLWTGIGPLAWGGKTFTGGGELLGISPIGENVELRAEGFQITLSGMPADKISLAQQSLRQNKPGNLWLAAFNDGDVLIADPYLLQSGKLDIARIRDEGETCTIAVRYEGRLIDLERPRERRWTSEDQALLYPGDKGFDYVEEIQETELAWG